MIHDQPPEERKSPAQVRIRGALLALPFGLLAAWYFAFLLSDREESFLKHGYLAAGPFLPFVYFATELLFGRTVPDLASSWDALAGWQRGVIGCGLVAVLFFLLMIVLFTVYDVW